MKTRHRNFFLQTAIVPVNVHGEIVHLRAILDSVSQNNLVTEAAVQRLQLKRKRNKTRVFGSEEMKSQLIADLLTFAFNQKTKHQLSLTRQF